MTKEPGGTPDGGWIPPESLSPPHNNSPWWIALHVVLFLLPLVGLVLAALAAAAVHVGLLLKGSLSAIAPALACAAVAAGAGWRLKLGSRKIRLMALGWEPAAAPSLLRAIGAAAGVLGILALVLILKMNELLRSPNEKATRGTLGAIRSALSIYYGDMEGLYPDDMNALTVGGKYLPEMPKAKTPVHHRSSARVLNGPQPDDSGGWYYNNVPLDPNVGSLQVNCTHTDVKGSVWTVY